MYAGTSPACGCNTRPGEMSGLGQGVLPFVSPATSILGVAASLFKGKPEHYSPWGFHVDEYSAHILDAERQIAQLKTQLATAMHQPPPQFPLPNWPPATPGKFSSSTKKAWYDAMRPVVAQYSSQADCVTNNNQVMPGGCYEQSYSQQLKLIEQLKTLLAQSQGYASLIPPAPGSATAFTGSAYLPYSGIPQPFAPVPGFPQSYAPAMPSYYPSAPSSTPQSVTITQPGGGAPQIFGADMNNVLLIGAGLLGLFLIMSANKAPEQPQPQKRQARRT